uniref:Uncharacterized protein n=1 Tax=Candidatus Kentrum sp. TUN TaxID=2126343 RepID=A0A451AMH3_9GAMM|nr:MAG: hypothetical protein BECKTUN1418F_GA0071002_11416 [Candidatus Kentron sp. TUN]VFK64781.1 MAG: hypothetical protein BECKTUN1418D_GA0071000_12882 [Candidatus Kentron sp. TUN]VFK67215.1 MAG: hypothetical protein BECKTUN1418E_GA0071001_11376 [Candidatus Kentron sp. TUN]
MKLFFLDEVTNSAIWGSNSVRFRRNRLVLTIDEKEIRSRTCLPSLWEGLYSNVSEKQKS